MDNDVIDTKTVTMLLKINMTVDETYDESPAAEYLQGRFDRGWRVVHEQFLFKGDDLYYCARLEAQAPGDIDLY